MQDKERMRKTFRVTAHSPLVKDHSQYIEGRMKKTMSTLHIRNLYHKK